MTVSISELVTWIELTHYLDRSRAGLRDHHDKMRYTRLRHKILKRQGEGVTPEDIAWIREKIRSTATK